MHNHFCLSGFNGSLGMNRSTNGSSLNIGYLPKSVTDLSTLFTFWHCVTSCNFGGNSHPIFTPPRIHNAGYIFSFKRTHVNVDFHATVLYNANGFLVFPVTKNKYLRLTRTRYVGYAESVRTDYNSRIAGKVAACAAVRERLCGCRFCEVDSVYLPLRCPLPCWKGQHRCSASFHS